MVEHIYQVTRNIIHTFESQHDNLYQDKKWEEIFSSKFSTYNKYFIGS